MLRTDYSFDQFIALSQRQPYLNPYDSEFYYRLEMIELGDGPYSYPAFKVGQTHIIDFPTFDSAVHYMEEHSKQMNLYRSRITQYPLFESMGERGTQWLYNEDGNLLDCTIVQKTGTPEETHFFGRPFEKQRFKSGDFAELLMNDEVRLVYVVARTRTPEECWEIYRQQESEYNLDYSADSYAIINNDEGHISYGISTALMKPRLPITEEMKDKMEKRYIALIESTLDGTNPTMKMIPIRDDDEETSDRELSPYGYGENPPYTLYQAENGKWGLIDGSGEKLPAEFKRGDNDCFARVPWEVVVFNPKKGFELQTWYDPCEVWFNFTFNNPEYPAEYAGLLWKKQEKEIKEYRKILYELIPNENHWLIDVLLQEKELEKKEDEDFDDAVDALLSRYPKILKPSVTNHMLEPVMSNSEIDRDVKIALWRAKVTLDHDILTYLDHFKEET